jgi:serine/threonine protein kinase
MQLKPDEAAKLAGELLDLETRHGADEESGLVGVPASGLLSAPGGRLGSYRISRLLGSGGMGEVYEAEQENPRRRVALKVMRGHLLNDELRRRFEHEVRILGSLQHPGIAQIYEAGQFGPASAEGGGGALEAALPTPFFAMEYVEGEPLTAYATSRKLGVRERLELFLRVCQAVEHAHQRGIIHRDLKPANILVSAPPPVATAADSKAGSTLSDQLGQPKVLDFGVARATDADVTVTSMHTEVGKLVGTLPYMSPEQASGNPDELDTRSDVYALGVVLYELLSGKLPYEVKGDGGARVAQALRVIKEVDPTPLSSIDRVFRGDLETIVGKALEKERERRYQSVGELAGDVRRYLDDEPIVARRAGALYEIRKFARRKRALVAGVMIVGVSLLGATIAASLMAVRESRARARAMAERESQEGMTTFLRGLLSSPSPEHAGRNAKVVDLLADAGRRLDGGGAPTEEVERALRESIGLAYLSLEEWEAARPHLDRAYEISSRLFGPDDLRTLDDDANLALLSFRTGGYESGLERMRQNVDRRKSLFGDNDKGTLEAVHGLGVALAESGRQADARDLLTPAVARSSELFGPDDLTHLKLAQELGEVLIDLGQDREAEALLTDCVERLRDSRGAENGQTLSAMNLLAIAYRRQGRLNDAIRLYQDAIDLSSTMYGPRDGAVLTRRFNLVQAISKRDGPGVAEPMLRSVLADTEASLGPADSMTLGMRYTLAQYVFKLGRKDEASTLLHDLVTVAEGHLPSNSAELALYRRDYGGDLLRQGKLDEAEPWLLKGYEGLSASVGPQNSWTVVAVRSLIELYEKKGNQEQAERFRGLLPEKGDQAR